MYLSNSIAIEYGLCIYFIPEKLNENGLHPKHSNAVLLISSYLNILKYAFKDFSFFAVALKTTIDISPLPSLLVPRCCNAYLTQ